MGEKPMGVKLAGLTVSGFRALSHVEIADFADVNLFVGKNSTGKTTLLEAIRVLLSKDIRPRLYSLLDERDEYNFRAATSGRRSGAVDGPELSYESLFSGRPELSNGSVFSISGTNDGPDLTIRFMWLHELRGDDASVRFTPSDGPEFDPEALAGFEIQRSGIRALLPLNRLGRLIARRALRDEDESVVFLPSEGLSIQEVGRIWDGIALTDDEDHVVRALQIISPTLEKLVMVESPERRGERMLMAKIGEFNTPVPFKSLGEGAYHLLSVVLALIKSRGSTLLIDEVASGIHYSVQPKLWSMIFDQAANFDVQVFATTHSWDCVSALSKAGSERLLQSASLFRLEKHGQQIRSVSFSGKELSIAAEEMIEIR
jgi:energy-coupling factor transporter ATP-binding protein EcfA2